MPPFAYATNASRGQRPQRRRDASPHAARCRPADADGRRRLSGHAGTFRRALRIERHGGARERHGGHPARKALPPRYLGQDYHLSPQGLSGDFPLCERQESRLRPISRGDAVGLEQIVHRLSRHAELLRDVGEG